MILSIINGWEEQHFSAVAAKGLSGIEFCINGGRDSAEVLARAEEIKGYSEKYGVKVVSIGRWGMARIDENGEVIPEALQHDKNLIDLASALGCPVFNAGVNYTDKFTYYDNCMIAVRYFSSLIEYARGKNVKIAAFNCSWDNFVVDEKAWSVVLGALPELGLKYDCSHCIERKGDYLKEIRDWGSRFYHFHIKGQITIAGDGYDDPPAGLDGIRWRCVMSVLYTVGYNGALSIEPHSSRWQGKIGQWGIDFTINFMKPFIMPEDYSYDENPYMP